MGGTELYGYLPYWLMTPTMASYLQSVPLTSLELFSVTSRSNGRLDARQLGYRRITAPIGAEIISGAHARGLRVELVFSSFGFKRNAALFGTTVPPQPLDPRWRSAVDVAGATAATLQARRTISDLIALATKLHVDGINLDIEQISSTSYDGYAAFVHDLRGALSAALPHSGLSAATMASQAGANLAAVSIGAGVGRIFVMGYDFHYTGSGPGGQAPIDRLDGGPSLSSTIAIYQSIGVPSNLVLLGLPTYGMAWPTASPDRYAPRIGPGVLWTPAAHAAELTAPGFSPHLDPLEVSEFFSEPVAPPGGAPPSPSAGTSIGPSTTYRAVFYDSPRTLEQKLALARAAGFAGAGFWAIGYERGVPGYTQLMADFLAGLIAPLAPPNPNPIPRTWSRACPAAPGRRQPRR